MISKFFSFFKKGGALLVPNDKFSTMEDDTTGVDREIREKCKVDGKALLDNHHQ